ncbi:MAG: hypothetical protein WEB57_07700 [Pseudohongiellaceae bacterium]
MFRTRYRPLFMLILLSLAACNEAPQESTDAGQTTDAERYTLELDMLQFMELVLEPVADGLWDSAGWIDDIEEGYFELYPTTDEGWEAVRHNAAMVVEAGNALALPSRAYDDDAWLTYSQAMSDVGLQAMAAAEARNEEELFQAGARLYSVCTACHQAYNPELSRFVDDEPQR